MIELEPFMCATRIAQLRAEAMKRRDLTMIALLDGAEGRGAVGAVRVHQAQRGWHLIGAGPASYGWATFSAAGRGTWLGRSAREACGALAERCAISRDYPTAVTVH